MAKFAKMPADRLAHERTRVLASQAWSLILSCLDNSEPWILDLGSGSGKHALFAPDSAHYVAYDLCELGRKFIRDRQEFVQGDVLELPFKRDVFDVAVLSHALEHFRDPSMVIRLVRRVLTVGGVLYVETPNPTYPHFWEDYSHVRPYSAYALRHLLDDNGFLTLAAGDIAYPSRAHILYRVLRRLGMESIGVAVSLHLARWFPRRCFSYACAEKTGGSTEGNGSD